MEVLVYLVPLALALGGLGLAGFLWSLKSGQFDDLDGAAWRAIADDDPPEPVQNDAGARLAVDPRELDVTAAIECRQGGMGLHVGRRVD